MQLERRRASASFSRGSRGGSLKTTKKVVVGKNGGRYREEVTRRPGKNGRKGRVVGRKLVYLGAS